MLPNEPNFNTSFAMSQNPFSNEEEYFLRLDLSALKLNEALKNEGKDKKRPKLNLHIIVDLAAPQQATFVKEREKLVQISTWKVL